MTRFAWAVILGIAACGQVADNSNQPDATVAQPPAAPTGVAATANIDLGARLTWTAPPGAPVTSYAVTAAPAGGSVKIVGTAALVTGLTVGQSYTFTVTASNATGTSAPSDPSSAVTIVAGPVAPASVSACGANASATVRGPAPVAGTTYNLYFDSAPGVSRLSMKQDNVTLPFSHTSLTNGTKLYYVLTAVDASGIESSESPEDSTTPDTAMHDSLVAASFSVNAIEIIDCVSKLGTTGAASSARTIKGAATLLAQNNYNNMTVDTANARIFHRNPAAIVVWDNATTVTGNVAPSRTFTSGTLTGGRGIAYDPMRDLLYVTQAADIQVFANAKTATGTVAPARTINVTNGAMSSMYIDVANDRLYVDNSTNILVYDSASTVTGAAAPARTITVLGATLSSYGITLDAPNNTLYVSSRNEVKTYAITNASTATGAAVPARTIQPQGATTSMAITFGGGKLFHISDSATTFLVFNNANMATGSVAPSQNLSFPTLTSGSAIIYAP